MISVKNLKAKNVIFVVFLRRQNAHFCSGANSEGDILQKALTFFAFIGYPSLKDFLVNAWPQLTVGVTVSSISHSLRKKFHSCACSFSQIRLNLQCLRPSLFLVILWLKCRRLVFDCKTP